jgi:hypothetical protein
MSLARHLARRLACVLAVTALVACQVESQDPPRQAARVLFVGNSLTYFNSLPDVVTRLAHDAGDSDFVAAMVAMPGYSLADHLDEGSAQRELMTKRWTHVVMQQGPSSLPEGAEELRRSTERFAPLVRQAGAEPVLYMVWPERTRPSAFDAVRRHYRDAAAAVDGIFAPAGDAWTLALAADSTLPLYGTDGFHPSPVGTWLAAVVLLARVRGIDPESLAPVIPGTSLPAERVRTLQRAAVAALARNPARP